ncbi:MAG: hypothetical protein ABI618_01890 [Nitrospirota bacterium]
MTYINQHRHALRIMTISFFVGVFGCASDATKSASETSAPSSIAQAEELPDQSPSGEIQERGVSRMAPGITGRVLKPQAKPPLGQITPGGLAIHNPPPALPGEFAFRTQKGFYLTAINGGGRSADPTVITSANSAGPWEKFRLAVTSPPSSHDKTIQTANGNYLTSVNGGGLSANVLHTDATQAKNWERFRLIDLGSGNPSNPTYYGIQTINGNYLTAVGAGGKYQDAMHTDAKEIKGWEQFRIVKCGDPGSGYEYGIMATNGAFLTAGNGGGRTSEAILLGSPNGTDPKFRLIRQSDGTYALLTANARNYVTALGGGGQVQTHHKCNLGLSGACLEGYSTIFHTNATQVQGWEKFKVIDQGNCTYAVQTASGFFVGIYKDSSGYTLLTTRRDGASTADEKFQLVVYGLASPVVLQ